MKVVPDIEQDQIAHFSFVERETIGVLNSIQPRIGEDVGSQSLLFSRISISCCSGLRHTVVATESVSRHSSVEIS